MKKSKRFEIADRQSYPFLTIPRIFFTHYKPSPTAILTFTALKYYTQGSTGTCERVSRLTLARLVGVSDSTIKRGIAELKKAGILRVHHRSKKSAKGNRVPLPNLYELKHLGPKDELSV